MGRLESRVRGRIGSRVRISIGNKSKKQNSEQGTGCRKQRWEHDERFRGQSREQGTLCRGQTR